MFDEADQAKSYYIQIDAITMPSVEMDLKPACFLAKYCTRVNEKRLPGQPVKKIRMYFYYLTVTVMLLASLLP